MFKKVNTCWTFEQTLKPSYSRKPCADETESCVIKWKWFQKVMIMNSISQWRKVVSRLLSKRPIIYINQSYSYPIISWTWIYCNADYRKWSPEALKFSLPRNICQVSRSFLCVRPDARLSLLFLMTIRRWRWMEQALLCVNSKHPACSPRYLPSLAYQLLPQQRLPALSQTEVTLVFLQD